MSRKMVLVAIGVLAGVAIGLLLYVLLRSDSSDVPAFVRCETEQHPDPAPDVRSGAPLDAVVLGETLEAAEATSAFFHPDGTMYVTQRPGTVLRADKSAGEVVLDITEDVGSEGFEQGLFSGAFSPDGSELYLHFTDRAGGTQIIAMDMVGGAPDLATYRELLSVEQPGHTHNGGQLIIDSDGLLWASLGDGAAAPLADLEAWGNAPAAQDLSNLYGSIVRIDPTPGDELAYSIPSGNPFVGDPGVRDEIWAYGMRNPWRFTFDRETGDLWIADVGQWCWEEVNVLYAEDSSGAGANLGWPAFEGRHLYRSDPPEEHVLPLFAYEREDEGRCAIAGGYVYRGSAIAELVGAYVFADLCSGEVMALVPQGEGWELRVVPQMIPNPVSFGERPDGELVVVSMVDGVYSLEPASGRAGADGS